MSTTAQMINLGYEDKIIFAVLVPDWSKQHELIINKNSSYIKFPSPKGWNWIKLLLNEQYEMIGLSTPNGLVLDKKSIDYTRQEIFGTIVRSHIITNANKFGIKYYDNQVYLIIELVLPE